MNWQPLPFFAKRRSPPEVLAYLRQEATTTRARATMRLSQEAALADGQSFFPGPCLGNSIYAIGKSEYTSLDNAMKNAGHLMVSECQRIVHRRIKYDPSRKVSIP